MPSSLPPRSQQLYDWLFGELPLGALMTDEMYEEFRAQDWRELKAAAKAWFANDHGEVQRRLQPLVKSHTSQSVLKSVAWRLLCHIDSPLLLESEARQMLGLVVELGRTDGIMVLAVYADETLAYFSSSRVIRPHRVRDPHTVRLMRELLTAIQPLTDQIDLFLGPRPGPPPAGLGRLTILTALGQHVAAGPLDMFETETMAGPILKRAREIVQLVNRGAGGSPHSPA